MATHNRPLSPHLQIYQWGWTMSLSILHRATGIVLSAGILLVAWWALALLAGPDAYAAFSAFAHGTVGRLILAAWVLAFFYHLCNGVRHLLWDAGVGLDVETARFSAAIVVAVAILLALLAWYLGAASLGGAA